MVAKRTAAKASFIGPPERRPLLSCTFKVNYSLEAAARRFSPSYFFVTGFAGAGVPGTGTTAPPAGTAGAVAAGTGAPAPPVVSKMLFFDCPPMIVRMIEVVIKTAAAACVKRVKKFAPPELPKTVWLEPENEAEISAPL